MHSVRLAASIAQTQVTARVKVNYEPSTSSRLTYFPPFQLQLKQEIMDKEGIAVSPALAPHTALMATYSTLGHQLEHTGRPALAADWYARALRLAAARTVHIGIIDTLRQALDRVSQALPTSSSAGAVPADVARAHAVQEVDIGVGMDKGSSGKTSDGSDLSQERDGADEHGYRSTALPQRLSSSADERMATNIR